MTLPPGGESKARPVASLTDGENPMFRALTLLAATLVLVSAGPTASAQYGRKPTVAQDKPEKTKSNVLFVVVLVDGDYQVIKKTDVKQFEKGIRDTFKDETKQWTEAKRQAAKDKQKFTDPKPVLPKVKIHSAAFKTEAEAGQYIEKEVAKADKGKK
jgi:hypothetical protein